MHCLFSKHYDSIPKEVMGDIRSSQPQESYDKTGLPHPLGVLIPNDSTNLSDSLGMPLEESSDSYSDHFRLRRQSSSLTFDSASIDRIIKKEDEFVLQSDSGHVIKLTSNDASPSDPCCGNELSGSESKTQQETPYHMEKPPCFCPNQNRIKIISLHNRFLFNKERCFTKYQAIEYWLQQKIVSSRGEASNLIHLLRSLGIIRGCRSLRSWSFVDRYSRRFHLTTLQVVPLDDIIVWEEPEVFPYGQELFSANIDYVFLNTVFNLLLAHEHTTVRFPRSIHQ